MSIIKRDYSSVLGSVIRHGLVGGLNRVPVAF